jgi:hypothetical protein
MGHVRRTDAPAFRTIFGREQETVMASFSFFSWQRPLSCGCILLQMSTATIPSTQACAVCQQVATQRCSRCKQTWYCSTEHQKQDWKKHKQSVCDDAYQADQYTLHKQEFDRIIQRYKLNTEEKSSAIAEFLTAGEEGSVSAAQFAEKFGTTPEEAVVFLEWIQVGVKFKQQSIDVANKSGFAAAKR